MTRIPFTQLLPGLNWLFKQTALRQKKSSSPGTVLLTVLSLVVLLASTGWAQDFILGEVIEVAPDRSVFTLQLDPGLGGETDAAANSRTVRVEVGKEQVYWPECVQVGQQVRVWGAYVEGAEAVFKAEQIRGTGWGRDKSGVRSRLSRGGNSRQQGLEQGMGGGMGPGTGMGQGGGGRGRNRH